MSQPGMADPHQFFDDTSSAPSRGYGGQPSPGGLGYPTSSSEAAFLAAPMSNMAMVYGSSLAAQGKELVDKNVSRLAWRAAGREPMASRGRGHSLSFVSPDRPLPPGQQAQVLLRGGHGVCGQEARVACVPLPPPGEQCPLGTHQEAGWKDPHPGVLPLPHLSPQDWEVQYQQDTPVAPRFDINAPDLYIPGCPPTTARACLGPGFGCLVP